jgi:hypothetical protein
MTSSTSSSTTSFIPPSSLCSQHDTSTDKLCRDSNLFANFQSTFILVAIKLLMFRIAPHNVSTNRARTTPVSSSHHHLARASSYYDLLCIKFFFFSFFFFTKILFILQFLKKYSVSPTECCAAGRASNLQSGNCRGYHHHRQSLLCRGRYRHLLLRGWIFAPFFMLRITQRLPQFTNYYISPCRTTTCGRRGSVSTTRQPGTLRWHCDSREGWPRAPASQKSRLGHQQTATKLYTATPPATVHNPPINPTHVMPVRLHARSTGLVLVRARLVVVKTPSVVHLSACCFRHIAPLRRIRNLAVVNETANHAVC